MDVHELVAAREQGRSAEATPWYRLLFRPFWVVPTLLLVAGLGLGLTLPLVDRQFEERLPWAFPGGPAGARSLVGTIAGAMISVTGLVFSITMVVLQLASSQFTPRVLGSFLHDRVVQATLGVFAATFTYSLAILRTVEDETAQRPAFVPQLSVTFAYVVVVLSVAFFLAFIAHVTALIRVSHVISRVGNATSRLADDYLPADEPSRAPLPRRDQPRSVVTLTQRHGCIRAIDEQRLVAAAAKEDATLELVVAPGDFVTSGMPLAAVTGGTPALEEEVHNSVRVGKERTLDQDLLFGVRQLVDIADRALSPGVNDPTTAVQVLDELHRILRLAVTRHDPPAHVTDETGVVRLTTRPVTVEALLRASLLEIATYGAEAAQIPDRLWTLLDDLAEAALPEHREALARTRHAVATALSQREDR